jgi:hypothetical protein
MTDYTLKAESGHINVSPTGFRLAARDYFKCYLDFHEPGHFSVVPFFLCCRAIELALKAMHLEMKSQMDVKKLYSHDLMASYVNLPDEWKSLSQNEVDLLREVNAIYCKKEFEYFSVMDAITGCTRFPEIDAVAQLARKITDYNAQQGAAGDASDAVRPRA